MRSDILRTAQGELQRLREENAALQARRRSEAVAACPEIGELLDGRQQIIYDSIRNMLRGQAGADAETRMAEQNRRIGELLTGIGKPADWLEPIYTCPDCRDTGYVGEVHRKECHCLRERCNRLLSSEALAEIGGEASFERFDLDLFPDEPLAGGVSQRRLMDRAFSKCKDWALSWPDDRHSCVLLSGASGLGKTYLMKCMARAMIERGLRVTMISAFRFLEIARRCHMTMESDAFDELMDADVVMIDDIGSEPMMNNITVVYLYNLINERQEDGKATVISTNLSQAELQKQYSERIASRLLDPARCHVFFLTGRDVRTYKR